MGLLSTSGFHSAEAKEPCTPSTEELIRKNREYTFDLQIVADALKVIDDKGRWNLTEIPHFREAFLAAYGSISLAMSATEADLERLLEQEAREKEVRQADNGL